MGHQSHRTIIKTVEWTRKMWSFSGGNNKNAINCVVKLQTASTNTVILFSVFLFFNERLFCFSFVGCACKHLLSKYVNIYAGKTRLIGFLLIYFISCSNLFIYVVRNNEIFVTIDAWTCHTL